MPRLVRFTIVHMSYGGLVGILTATAMMMIRPEAFGHGGGVEYIALMLQLYAFAATFSLGSLATALALLQRP
ncbi:hypothetical protein LPJGGPFB_05144 [Ensifer adhaerens]|nr:hypothetical protein [Ensifer adhaerens]